MKIAIHNRPGSFSDRWIEYCEQQGIDYKVVNAYDSDIVDQVKDCDAFMMHHHQSGPKDVLFAKQLLYSLETAGIRCFPNFRTTWHFDDKVGQKYLLEAIDAPFVPSYVFYSKLSALKWIQTTSFPKVFKLRGGASGANVKLVRSKTEAQRLIHKAFGRGFSRVNSIGGLKERLRKWKEGKDSFVSVLKGLGRLIIPTEYAQMRYREKGYVLFQDFIAGNDFDIRTIVIGEKCFGIKRLVRNNDFRASGSGNIHYRKDEIPEECVRISFNLSKIMKTQSIAFDFVFDQEGKPLIIEISYAFLSRAYDACPGFWTSDMEWHEGPFNPLDWMVDDILKQ